MYMTAHLALDFHLLKCKIAVILKCKYSNFTTRLFEVQRQLEMQTVIFLHTQIVLFGTTASAVIEECI